MERILIVNVNWLGDTLFVIPFIRALRESHPQSYISVLTHPRCGEVLMASPHIDEIIIYDEKGRNKHLLSKFAVISQLKSKKFDIAFILRKSLSRSMLLFLSKIPRRIGYDNKRAGFLLTKKVPLPTKVLHKAEYFLGLARAVGIDPKKARYEFFISDTEKKEAAKILREAGLKKEESFIAINAGGNWDLKRWPAENFAELGDRIYDKLHLKVVLTGAVKDIELCKKISDMMKHKPILLCGKTDLKTLGAIFEMAKWAISNDSGPMHIAAGMGASLVALFGPTSPEITGPYGNGVCVVLRKDIGCKIPCYMLSCKDNKCMKAITVEEVLRAIS
ncbi:MAG: lipopolysaccharide heptosyltransferase II [Candidatus Omnitrophica bacterium]|nr:lipopolysaccharide heptosyltransferase II [Candidatus Omnitrophota bacterium]